jgi:membrane associated rhomboid family serine protease
LALTDKLISRSSIIGEPQINDWYRLGYNNLSSEKINASVVEEAKKFISLFIKKNADSKMVGASGAIYGLIAALGVMFPNTKFMLLFPPIPVKAKWLALFLGGYAFYQGIQFNPADNVGHFAHLGGALIGAILIFQWKRKGR